ncbi:transposable element Tcb2 transposase [Trichonephila clavipes]|nr:transposable element Tcb2 transposase [Trichonephila clavipes]
MGLGTSHRLVQIHTLENEPKCLLSRREQPARYDRSNIVERCSYGYGGIMVWAGIFLGDHTDLLVFYGGILTGVKYRVAILDRYYWPYAHIYIYGRKATIKLEDMVW